MKKLSLLFTALLFLFLSCNQRKEADSLFQLMENTGIDFTNTVHNTKDFNIFTYRNFYNGGGVGCGDINNDGLADVFFTSNMGSNKLYLNKGNFQFEDITAKSGLIHKGKWGTGVVMVDINADGWLDIYVCYAGYQKGVGQENELYINNRDLTFTEAAAEYGLSDDGYTTHAAFFDYDIDGDLDCYILNNSFIPVNTLNYANKRELRAEDWPVADFLKGGGDKLLRNDDGKFVDVSKEANIYGSLIGFGLGVTVGDVNGDYYPDIYISNDFFERDYLYVNQKDGTFKDELEERMQHTSLASMGADMGDINNDGYAEIFTTDMLPADDYRLKTTSLFDNIDVYRLKQQQGFYHQFMQNTLQLNNKNGKFSDIAFYSGVAASDWSWGGVMFDADNDGFSDLFVCNGIYHDVTDQDFIDFFANDVIQQMALTGQKEEIDQIINRMPSHPISNKAFKNLGNLRFADAATEWGLDQKSFSNGAAYADLDNDGDLDLVVNNVNQPSFVYKNKSSEASQGNYVGFTLKGKDKNTFAIGSTVKVFSGDQILTREIIPSKGFQSSVDYRTIVGLGKRSVDSVHIVWPDRSYIVITQPQVNKVYRVEQKGATPVLNPLQSKKESTLLDSLASPFVKHQEDEYTDYYYERGIPMLLSRQGPKAAQGDVNGDGLMDLFIGGAAGQGGQLYLQTSNGFVKKEQPAFAPGSVYEDVAVLFFDADSDKDLDLFIGSGGNHQPANSFQLQNRLYKNDGKGNFSLDASALPSSGNNTGVAIANDVDGDGDEDLFIGSRSIPQNYGKAPQSYILVNDGKGRFKDIAQAVNPEIAFIGMVTAAAWADVTADGKKELIIVGEWMAPRIFSFNQNRFIEVNAGFEELRGLWQSIAADDVDGDGDIDLVLGNIGENFYLQPTPKEPVKLWVSDFDNNGTAEKIFTRTVNGKDVTVFLKKDVTEQIASLRKQNLKYVDFAKKSFQELFSTDVVKNCLMKDVTYSSSCIAYNEGNGQFRIQRLPDQVQFSSVNAILCTDINKDGKQDLILGGNIFDLQPQFSRLDASYGNLLLNEGNQSFQVIQQAESGLHLPGVVRDIVSVRMQQQDFLLFLQNNSTPALYRVNSNKP